MTIIPAKLPTILPPGTTWGGNKGTDTEFRWRVLKSAVLSSQEQFPGLEYLGETFYLVTQYERYFQTHEVFNREDTPLGIKPEDVYWYYGVYPSIDQLPERLPAGSRELVSGTVGCDLSDWILSRRHGLYFYRHPSNENVRVEATRVNWEKVPKGDWYKYVGGSKELDTQLKDEAIFNAVKLGFKAPYKQEDLYTKYRLEQPDTAMQLNMIREGYTTLPKCKESLHPSTWPEDSGEELYSST